MISYKPVIFVVEDDPIFNKLISRYLSSNINCEVHSFYLGEDCMEAINNLDKKPDIILQDYELPFQNGIEVMQYVKKKYPETIFIFLSGQGNIKVAVNALHEGAYDYIVKDAYAKENALNKIDQALKLRFLEKSNRYNKLSTNILIGLVIVSWTLLLLYYFLMAK